MTREPDSLLILLICTISSHLRAHCCGAVYHGTRSLRAHCDQSLCDSDRFYEIGPLQDCALLRYPLIVPSPSQTPPVFTTTDYVRLLPSTVSPPLVPLMINPFETRLSSFYQAYTPYILIIHSSVHPPITLFSVSAVETSTMAISLSIQPRVILLGSSTGNALVPSLAGRRGRRWMARRRP